MGIFEMITVIVVAGLLLEAFKSWRNTGGKFDKKAMKDFFGSSEDWDDEWDDVMGGNGKKVKSLEAEVAELKERVKTLETIVTDPKYQLDQEIANLK